MAVTGSGKGIQIVVGTNYNDRDLKRAQADLNRLRGQAAATQGPMRRLGNTLRANLGPALAMAGAAAGAFAIKLGVDGVKAAIADQKTVEVLAQTLENLGQAHKQAGVEEFVASLESATGVADEKLRPALGMLVTATGDVEEAQRRLKQAMDLAVFGQVDLQTVSKALSRSLATQTSGTLSRYGLVIDQNTVATEGFGAALDEAMGKVSGLAEREAKTLEGQLRILATEFGNVQEAFGYGFLGGLGDATDGVGDMSQMMRDFKPIAHDLGEQIGTLAKALSDLNDQTGIVAATFKGLTDITGPTLDAILTLYRVLGQGEDPVEALKQQFFGLGEGYDDVADGAGNASWLTAKAGEVFGTTAGFAGEMADETDDAADALKELNDQMKEFFGFLDERDAVRGYQDAIDNLRESLKENGKTFDINTEAGRDNQKALDGIFDSALKVAEGQATAAQKIATMEGAARDATRQLDKTKMSDAAKAALLAPFDDAIARFTTATTKVGNLKAAMETIPTKINVNVTVGTTYVGTPPPGGFPTTRGSAYGGYVGGHGGTRADDVPAMLSSGEFVIQAPAVAKFGKGFFAALNQGVNPLAGMTPRMGGSGGGLTINGGITVQSAPGERAETSLPRALRRASFLAGVNG
jgi:uncharacterized protein YukE